MFRSITIPRWLPTAFPRRSPRNLPRHRRRLNLEGLEPRQLLAADVGPSFDPGPDPDYGIPSPNGGIVPTTNLWVRDTYVTDADGNRIDQPAIGTRVFVQAEFATNNLPLGCSFPTECRYDVKFSIDGDPRWSGPLNWGIGVSGTRYWVARLGEWLVTPGSHSVSVELDATQRIPEINESDNRASFRFTAQSFQSIYGQTRFITPIDGLPNSDYAIVNYVDLNSGSGISDFNGGTYTYNGHNAIDYTVANFARTDIGLPIVAAASGVVSDLNDGVFDRNTCPSTCNLDAGNWGNYVTVDHGNGWTTSYLHLRKNSIVVSEGDYVGTGAPLGLMGSSGNSSDAHLHFAVNYLGETVETYVAPTSYWANPLPYAGHLPGVLDYGTTDHEPSTAELKERPPEREVFPATPLTPIHFWVNVHGISAGDQLSFVWKRPDGSTYDTTNYTASELHYGWQSDRINLPLFFPQTGEWSVEFRRNGVTLAADTFEVGTTSRDGGFEFDAANYYTTENSGTARLDRASRRPDQRSLGPLHDPQLHRDGRCRLHATAAAPWCLPTARSNNPSSFRSSTIRSTSRWKKSWSCSAIRRAELIWARSGSWV